MEITFTHTGGSTDWVYVLLDSGTPLRWPWPTYGADLPPDLVHYLVETRLGIRHGFWGLVADGANFGYLSYAADQVRSGLPVAPPAGGQELDLTELVQVECVSEAVAAGDSDGACLRLVRSGCAGRAVPVPAALDSASAGAPEKAIGELRAELADLTARWHALAAGRSLVLSYTR